MLLDMQTTRAPRHRSATVNLPTGSRGSWPPGFPRITAEEEIGLIARARASDGKTADARRAADALVLAHFPYMLRLATSFARNGGWQVADILSCVFEGFAKALRMFDPARGNRLLTYASWWFRHEMREFAQRETVFGKSPNSSVEAAMRAITALGGSLDVDAIAERAGVTQRTAEYAVTVYRGRGISLDTERRYVGDDDDRTLYSRLPADAPDPEEALAEAQYRALRAEAVTAALAGLDARAVAILSASTMADDEEAESYAELGRKMGGISRERVRQLEARARERLAGKLGPKPGITRAA